MREDEIKWDKGWDKTLPDTVQTENMSQEINISESILGNTANGVLETKSFPTIFKFSGSANEAYVCGTFSA